MLFSPSLARKETFHSDYLDEDIVDLLGGTFNVPKSYPCSIMTVDAGYECRSDLISDAVYGDDMYSDIIVKLNGSGDPFGFNVDQSILVPGMDEVNEFFQQPAKAWSEQYLAAKESRPKPKNRSEKRKPNQSVVGDKRFNIDTQSNIIIY